MIPNFPIATDNIYKFACLFGLAIIVASIVSFVSIYSSTLDRKVKLSEVIIALEAKDELTAVEKNSLELNRRLLEVTKSNEHFAQQAVGGAFSLGLVLSIYGAHQWHTKIQARDDLLATLQIEKLRAEIAKLELEANRLRSPENGQSHQQAVTTQNEIKSNNNTS